MTSSGRGRRDAPVARRSGRLRAAPRAGDLSDLRPAVPPARPAGRAHPARRIPVADAAAQAGRGPPLERRAGPVGRGSEPTLAAARASGPRHRQPRAARGRRGPAADPDGRADLQLDGDPRPRRLGLHVRDRRRPEPAGGRAGRRAEFVETQGDETKIGLVLFSGFAQLAVAPTTNKNDLLTTSTR